MKPQVPLINAILTSADLTLNSFLIYSYSYAVVVDKFSYKAYSNIKHAHILYQCLIYFNLHFESFYTDLMDPPLNI